MKRVIIDGVETTYFVTKNGEVYNQKTDRFLKGCVFNNGYRFVNLIANGKKKNHLVHRLVAVAFLPNPNNLPVVNHKDGNKLNNKLENLEWCTFQQNSQHAHEVGLIKKQPRKARKAQLTKEQLLKDWREYENTEYFVSREGEVYSQKTQRFLNKVLTSDGYERVFLRKEGKTKEILVHRLVAIVWLEFDESNERIVNHKDGNKSNNSISNLEIVSKKENAQHSCYVLEKGIKKVVRYKEGEPDVVYPSMTACAEANGVCISTISLAIKEHSKSRKGGYYYKFLEDKRD